MPRRRSRPPRYPQFGDSFDGGTVVEFYVYPSRPEVGVVLYQAPEYSRAKSRFFVAECLLAGNRRYQFATLHSEFRGDFALGAALQEFYRRAGCADPGELVPLTKRQRSDLAWSLTHMEEMLNLSESRERDDENYYREIGIDPPEDRTPHTVDYGPESNVDGLQDWLTLLIQRANIN
jgi:hypothetical protein